MGLAGLIVALFSIAAFYLWPEKRFIGWMCLLAAAILSASWLWAEFPLIMKEFGRENPIASSLAVGMAVGIIAGASWYLYFAKGNSNPVKPPDLDIPGITDVPAPAILAQRPWLRESLEWIGITKLDPINEPKKHTIAVLASIVNLGTPTVVKDYSLFIRVPGKPIPIPIFNPDIAPAKIVTQPTIAGGKRFVIFREDSLADKTAERPIPNGGSVKGFLFFSTDAISDEEFQNPKIEFTVVFKDVRFLQTQASGSISFSNRLPDGFAGLKSGLQ